MRGVLDTDIGACGIGFVADLGGRPRREILDLVLGGLARVRHRGALAADAKSSDGAGVLLPLSTPLLEALCAETSLEAPEHTRMGVGMIFLAPSRRGTCAGRHLLERALALEGLNGCAWREVPLVRDTLGDCGLSTLPRIEQLFFEAPRELDPEEAERRCFRARRRVEVAAMAHGLRVYVASLSFQTICYKALCSGERLADCYPDLRSPGFAVSFGIFHQRFSTNTCPSWERAQPYRLLGHNGEINTIQGNERRMRARSELGAERTLGAEDLIRPLLDPALSDSGKLDSATEVLLRAGRELGHAIAMLIPESWEGGAETSPVIRDFYHYHACLMEPWGGPAALIATDGRRIVASLDRNGFRPLRWWHCEDGLVAGCSEAGAIDLAGHGKIARRRLGPGQMLCVDIEAGELEWDRDLKRRLALRADYGRWIREDLLQWDPGSPVETSRDDLLRSASIFGWTQEDLGLILAPMAETGEEPRFSMGDDAPPPVFASFARPIHHGFKQRFAQVTNPPLDSLREEMVMSLRTCVGPRDPLLLERQQAARLIEFPTFLLFPSAMEQLIGSEELPWPVEILEAVFPHVNGPKALETACTELAIEAERRVRGGAGVLVIRDRVVSRRYAPIPILLALGAVHQHLVRVGLRNRVGLVCDTDEPRDTHHFAILLGYGADLICPRLALEWAGALADAGELGEAVDRAAAQRHFARAVERGVLKIMSKMGVSTVQSYRAAQLFEGLGIGPDIIERCFAGTVSQVGGLSWECVGEELGRRHGVAWEGDGPLPNPGLMRSRKGGEYHANNPKVVAALHAVVGFDRHALRRRKGASPRERGVVSGKPAARIRVEEVWERYLQFAALVNERPPSELQDLFEWVPAQTPIPLEEVESVEAICRRFTTAAISHGAISREAHENLAIAMNRLGGKSNSGEGGEARERFSTRGQPEDRNSRIKQVASGRFGVTPEYCRYADELQIKMAQGSKPGEGGQISGEKVTEEIARQRHTPVGVSLISPPPHHDIYSIEDLAQLIFDLKQVNRAAEVSVKLAAEAGVGTIASGVVKGLADAVCISGCTGGTGASPLSSIKHAGLPWALGLAETQRVLMENGLRGRVRLCVDGGLKTGRDVIVAALLGADEYSFGTAVLLAQGCVMVRSCHLGTCPAGIATQRPELRARFSGTPEMVQWYLVSVAQEVRMALARLGFRSMEEAIGRSDRLFQGLTGDPRIDSVDLSSMIAAPGPGACHFEAHVPAQSPRSSLGDRIEREVLPSILRGERIERSYAIGNADRAVGAALGGALAEHFGPRPVAGHAQLRLRGAAGQSFGAFLAEGVELDLTGEANDGVGKGMCGGRIVIRPPEDDLGNPHLAGNSILYGATGGELFIAGRAGERFGVRNSGAEAVVEGVGYHACEYMTGGTVLVLGSIGMNLGAGMTGGRVFVYDEKGELPRCLNGKFVREGFLEPVELAWCHARVHRHHLLTGSTHAADLLEYWAKVESVFRCVRPC